MKNVSVHHIEIEAIATDIFSYSSKNVRHKLPDIPIFLFFFIIFSKKSTQALDCVYSWTCDAPQKHNINTCRSKNHGTTILKNLISWVSSIGGQLGAWFSYIAHQNIKYSPHFIFWRTSLRMRQRYFLPFSGKYKCNLQFLLTFSPWQQRRFT